MYLLCATAVQVRVYEKNGKESFYESFKDDGCDGQQLVQTVICIPSCRTWMFASEILHNCSRMVVSWNGLR